MFNITDGLRCYRNAEQVGTTASKRKSSRHAVRRNATSGTSFLHK